MFYQMDINSKKGIIMYRLYSLAGTCSTGITVLLEKLDVKYEVIQRDSVENYSDIVPTNQVPALVVDNQVITEGAAIVLYLLEKHSNEMMPTELSEKAEFLRWLMFNYSTLHPLYGKIVSIVYTMDESEVKEKLLQQMADQVSSTWKILNNRLKEQQYIVGNKVTIIDYLTTIYTSWGQYFPQLNFTFGKNVERLVNEVNGLDEFQAAYKNENKEFYCGF